MEPDSIELNNETDTVSIDSSIISNTLSCTNNLNTSNTDLSPGKEIENAPILSIETVQVVLEEDKEGTDLSSADSRSLHQSSSISKEITKSISSRCNSNNTSAIIETAAEQYHGQEPPALLQTRSISEDNTTENIIESEEAVNLLAVTSSLDDETIDNNIVSTENDICLPKNNTSTDANHQTNSNATSIAAKRRSVYSLIPLKQQQAVTEEPPLTTSKIPVVQINNTRQQQGTGNSRGIPLPSRLSTTIIPPAIIQETLTAISSPSSSSGSLGKSMRSMSSVSTSSRSSNNSQHSQQQQQQQRKGTGGRSPVHNYRPLIQPQSKIPIAATVNPAAEIAKLAETVIPVSHHHISRLPKRNSTIM